MVKNPWYLLMVIVIGVVWIQNPVGVKVERRKRIDARRRYAVGRIRQNDARRF